MPVASTRQFIEFAVYIPEQEPHVGQAASSSAASSSVERFPCACAPTASNISERPKRVPLCSPGSIGPPLIKRHGRFSRHAASIIPGTILSQFGRNTAASTGCAVSITSMESAINSREQSEYFIPLWFMARPSHTPMVWKVKGTPPALRMPAFTASPMSFKCRCPGM